jgi:hypothetical protein
MQVDTVMVNNSININKTNCRLSSQILEHDNVHGIHRIWLRTDITIWLSFTRSLELYAFW